MLLWLSQYVLPICIANKPIIMHNLLNFELYITVDFLILPLSFSIDAVTLML